MPASKPSVAQTRTISADQRRFVNRQALAIHAFVVTWVGMLCAFTGVLWRDGAPPRFSVSLVAGILAVFWIAGCGLLVWASRQECVDLRILHNGDLRVTLWRPFSRRRLQIRAVDVRGATVLDDKDSDGDPYFRCQVESRCGPPIDIGGGSDRQAAAQLAERFNRLRRLHG